MGCVCELREARLLRAQSNGSALAHVETMAWQLGAEQAVSLLIYRCRQIAYDDQIDEDALCRGEPRACIPILRYLFTGFSEALSHTCERAGYRFSPTMSDPELLEAIIGVWSTLAPDQAALGGVSVAKLLQSGSWGVDRLLFTLQCVLVCSQAHTKAIAQQDVAWLDGIDWSNTSPQQQFNEHPTHVGTESQQIRSTVAWMAEAYREQLNSLDSSLPKAGLLTSVLPTIKASMDPTHLEPCLPTPALHPSQITPGRGESIAPTSGSREDHDDVCDAGAYEQAVWLARLQHGSFESVKIDRSAASMSTIVAMGCSASAEVEGERTSLTTQGSHITGAIGERRSPLLSDNDALA